jgi:cysteinyl-tRNA synthetase
MGRLKFLLLIAIVAFATIGMVGCNDSGNGDDEGMSRDYRQDMRDFVQGISAYSKGIHPDFIIIPQNGHDLLTDNGDPTGTPVQSYVDTIDGVGREDLFYGYEEDDVATPISERDQMIAFMNVAESQGVQVLAIDYCWTQSFVDSSYAQNAARGYISFAADHRELDDIPSYPVFPYNVNASNIVSLTDARNFLYILDLEAYPNKNAFLAAVGNTNFDLVIIDLFFQDTDQFTSSEIVSLKTKANGGSRLVIAYMSIGEAENYRYYWQPEWNTNPPSWLAGENPEWQGNFKVRYWDPTWQSIIFGNDSSYVKKILDAGFDGVYLDIIDAYEYFENQ